MRAVPTRMRRQLVAILAAIVLVPVSLIAGASPVAADTTVTATTGVNVRSAPSTNARIVGGLYRGQTATAISSASGWTRIRFARATAYVASRYLASGPTLPTPDTVDSGAVRVTTTRLNLRTGPGLSYRVITVLADGTRVTLSGKTSRGYAEVYAGTRRGWVSTQYLAKVGGLPEVIGVRVATAALAIRTTSGTDAKTVDVVPKGTRLEITGATQNGRAQIVYEEAVRWVTARYLANPTVDQPSVPDLPPIVGTRYATADLLVRSSSEASYTVITQVPKGTALDITGVEENGRAQIVWVGAVRWVNARYLSADPPPTTGSTYAVERGLNANAIRVHRACRATFPEIKTYYGRRAGSGSDHNVGAAIDIMIPNYKSASGQALGERIANWARVNQPSLRVTYMIWNQRIWNVSRANEGWRYMASRGSDTANHKDHVHVSVQR